MAQEGQHAEVGVVGIEPGEAAVVEVAGVKRRLVAIALVEIAQPAMQAAVRRLIEQIPVEAALIDPTRALWPSSPPIKSSFLPGCAHLQRIEQAQVGASLPSSPAILP